MRFASTTRSSEAKRLKPGPHTRVTWITARAKDRCPCSSRSEFSPSSLTIGGLVVIPGVWHPFTEWIGETAEALVDPTVAEDYETSAIVVALGLVGFYVARRAFFAGSQLVTSPGVWRVLEHKFYFDELYDALFYRPAVAISTALRRNVEEPVIERSLDELGAGTIQLGGEVARVQSGLLRTYAVAIAFGVCVLVVVFVAVR